MSDDIHLCMVKSLIQDKVILFNNDSIQQDDSLSPESDVSIIINDQLLYELLNYHGDLLNCFSCDSARFMSTGINWTQSCSEFELNTIKEHHDVVSIQSNLSTPGSIVMCIIYENVEMCRHFPTLNEVISTLPLILFNLYHSNQLKLLVFLNSP